MGTPTNRSTLAGGSSAREDDRLAQPKRQSKSTGCGDPENHRAVFSPAAKRAAGQYGGLAPHV